MRVTATRERLVEAIRAAYRPNNDMDADGPGCGCCWGNTCPEHAAAAVLAVYGAVPGADMGEGSDAA